MIIKLGSRANFNLPMNNTSTQGRNINLPGVQQRGQFDEYGSHLQCVQDVQGSHLGKGELLICSLVLREFF